MKIVIGSVVKRNGSSLALEIPGVGIVPAVEDMNEYPYRVVELSKEQLRKLASMIEKELNDEKTNVVRLLRSKTSRTQENVQIE